MSFAEDLITMRDGLKKMRVLSELCGDLSSQQAQDSRLKLNYSKTELLRLAQTNSKIIEKMKTKETPH